MSGFDAQGHVPVQPQPDETVEMASGGAWSLVLGLAHLTIGGVALALAVDEGFGEGKAAFASDAWRFLLGGVGLVLALLAIRGILRTVGARSRNLTPEVRRTAARRGLVLALVGAWLAATATVDALADRTIDFDAWTVPLFAAGGVYLTLLGLSMQLDPTRSLRLQRLREGYGAAGTATILRASDTGTRVNEAPQVQIDFRIEVEGRSFEASDRIVMEQAKLALLVPGSTVNVLVDRGDQRAFHVDWNSWKPPASAGPPD